MLYLFLFISVIVVCGSAANAVKTDDVDVEGYISIEAGIGTSPDRVVPVPRRYFNIDVWTDRRTYYNGDNIRVYFRANRDAYVFIFDTDPSGVTRQLFPNWYDRDNFVQAHRTYSIPDYNYDLRVTGPRGREYLRAVAVRSKPNFLDPFYRFRSGEPFPRIERGPRAMIEELKKHGSKAEKHERKSETKVSPERIVPVPPAPPPPSRPYNYAESATSFYVRDGDYWWHDPNDRYDWEPPDYYDDHWYSGRKATLTIRSIPSNARIYIDGSYYGETTKSVQVRPGRHTVRLVKRGFLEWEDRVFVRAGQREYIRARLDHRSYRRHDSGKHRDRDTRPQDRIPGRPRRAEPDEEQYERSRRNEFRSRGFIRETPVDSPPGNADKDVRVNEPPSRDSFRDTRDSRRGERYRNNNPDNVNSQNR